MTKAKCPAPKRIWSNHRHTGFRIASGASKSLTLRTLEAPSPFTIPRPQPLETLSFCTRRTACLVPSLRMPRSRSGGRAPARPTVPARKPQAPNQQQTRSASTYAPAQQAKAPAQTSQGPGLFGQMASTAAYVFPSPSPVLAPLATAHSRAILGQPSSDYG